MTANKKMVDGRKLFELFIQHEDYFKCAEAIINMITLSAEIVARNEPFTEEEFKVFQGLADSVNFMHEITAKLKEEIANLPNEILIN